jgi:hypothetical protein
MVSASKDSTVKIWDLRNGRALYRLEAHQGSVNTCAFSYNGDTFVSGGSDKTLIGWDYDFSKVDPHAGLYNGTTGPVIESQGFLETASFKETIKEAGAPRMHNNFLFTAAPAELRTAGLSQNFNQSSMNSNLMETRDLLMSSEQNQQESMPRPAPQPQQQIKVTLVPLKKNRKLKLILKFA